MLLSKYKVKCLNSGNMKSTGRVRVLTELYLSISCRLQVMLFQEKPPRLSKMPQRRESFSLRLTLIFCLSHIIFLIKATASFHC